MLLGAGLRQSASQNKVWFQYFGMFPYGHCAVLCHPAPPYKARQSAVRSGSDFSQIVESFGFSLSRPETNRLLPVQQLMRYDIMWPELFLTVYMIQIKVWPSFWQNIIYLVSPCLDSVLLSLNAERLCLLTGQAPLKPSTLGIYFQCKCIATKYQERKATRPQYTTSYVWKSDWQ